MKKLMGLTDEAEECLTAGEERWVDFLEVGTRDEIYNVDVSLSGAMGCKCINIRDYT